MTSREGKTSGKAKGEERERESKNGEHGENYRRTCPMSLDRT